MAFWLGCPLNVYDLLRGSLRNFENSEVVTVAASGRHWLQTPKIQSFGGNPKGIRKNVRLNPIEKPEKDVFLIVKEAGSGFPNP